MKLFSNQFYKNVLAACAFFCVINQLDAQDKGLTLWYNQPAQKWTDALPIGNGHMGAMVFGGIQEEHLQFNEATLWTGNPRNYNSKNAFPFNKASI
jgi:alpha-L-fucosidase 2